MHPDEQGRLDLKKFRTRLLVDGARILALAHGVAQVQTVARLEAAGPLAGMAPRDRPAGRRAEAFLHLQGLRRKDTRPGPWIEAGARQPDPPGAAGGNAAGHAQGGLAPGPGPAAQTWTQLRIHPLETILSGEQQGRAEARGQGQQGVGMNTRRFLGGIPPFQRMEPGA